MTITGERRPGQIEPYAELLRRGTTSIQLDPASHWSLGNPSTTSTGARGVEYCRPV